MKTFDMFVFLVWFVILMFTVFDQAQKTRKEIRQFRMECVTTDIDRSKK